MTAIDGLLDIFAFFPRHHCGRVNIFGFLVAIVFVFLLIVSDLLLPSSVCCIDLSEHSTEKVQISPRVPEQTFVGGTGTSVASKLDAAPREERIIGGNETYHDWLEACPIFQRFKKRRNPNCTYWPKTNAAPILLTRPFEGGAGYGNVLHTALFFEFIAALTGRARFTPVREDARAASYSNWAQQSANHLARAQALWAKDQKMCSRRSCEYHDGGSGCYFRPAFVDSPLQEATDWLSLVRGVRGIQGDVFMGKCSFKHMYESIVAAQMDSLPANETAYLTSIGLPATKQYQCIMRALFEAPTESLAKSLFPFTQRLSSNDVLVAIHVRFGNDYIIQNMGSNENNSDSERVHHEDINKMGQIVESIVHQVENLNTDVRRVRLYVSTDYRPGVANFSRKWAKRLVPSFEFTPILVHNESKRFTAKENLIRINAEKTFSEFFILALSDVLIQAAHSTFTLAAHMLGDQASYFSSNDVRKWDSGGKSVVPIQIAPLPNSDLVVVDGPTAQAVTESTNLKGLDRIATDRDRFESSHVVQRFRKRRHPNCKYVPSQSGGPVMLTVPIEGGAGYGNVLHHIAFLEFVAALSGRKRLTPIKGADKPSSYTNFVLQDENQQLLANKLYEKDHAICRSGPCRKKRETSFPPKGCYYRPAFSRIRAAEAADWLSLVRGLRAINGPVYLVGCWWLTVMDFFRISQNDQMPPNETKYAEFVGLPRKYQFECLFRTLFEPNELLARSLNTVLGTLAPKDVLVAVHIRFGDQLMLQGVGSQAFADNRHVGDSDIDRLSQLIEAISRKVENGYTDGRKARVYIATDYQPGIEHFSKRWGERIIPHFEINPRLMHNAKFRNDQSADILRWNSERIFSEFYLLCIGDVVIQVAQSTFSLAAQLIGAQTVFFPRAEVERWPNSSAILQRLVHPE